MVHRHVAVEAVDGLAVLVHANASPADDNIHPPLLATDLVRDTLDHLEVAEVALDKLGVGHDAILGARLPNHCDGLFYVLLLAQQNEDTGTCECHGAGDFKA